MIKKLPLTLRSTTKILIMPPPVCNNGASFPPLSMIHALRYALISPLSPVLSHDPGQNERCGPDGAQHHGQVDEGGVVGVGGGVAGAGLATAVVVVTVATVKSKKARVQKERGWVCDSPNLAKEATTRSKLAIQA